MSIQEAKNLLQYAMQNYGTGDCLKNAEELLLHDAEQGNTEAMCLLGDIFYWMADEEMYREAFAWYQRATHSGDTRALAKIGWCYCKGHGTEKDIVRGFRCLEQAVTRGSVTAMVKLGVLYLTGCEVEKNPANAVKLFDMAEKRGSKAARWYLAGCIERGEGVGQSVYKALELYRINAVKGDHNSLRRVLDIERELRDEEAEWSFVRLKILAKTGEPLSEFLLGEAFEKGIGTRKSYDEAARWYRLAADQNLAEAQYRLAFCYENGYGVDKDEGTAFKLRQFAANNENGWTDYMLDEEGECFYWDDIMKMGSE